MQKLVAKTQLLIDEQCQALIEGSRCTNKSMFHPVLMFFPVDATLTPCIMELELGMCYHCSKLYTMKCVDLDHCMSILKKTHKKMNKQLPPIRNVILKIQLMQPINAYLN